MFKRRLRRSERVTENVNFSGHIRWFFVMQIDRVISERCQDLIKDRLCGAAPEFHTGSMRLGDRCHQADMAVAAFCKAVATFGLKGRTEHRARVYYKRRLVLRTCRVATTGGT